MNLFRSKKNKLSLHTFRLSYEFAQQHSGELLEIHNLIPYQNWSVNELLASRDDSRLFSGKWKHSRVCCLFGKIAGLCIAFELEEYLYIHRLAVRKEQQHKGLGSSLVFSVLKGYSVLHKEMRLVKVQTPIEKNGEGDVVGFYKALGFYQCGFKKYTDREDYILEAKISDVLSTIKNQGFGIYTC